MPPTSVIGQTIAHYKVTAKLGAGGMGEVYRATDTKLGRDVALKVLPGEMARDPHRLARFAREARAVAALNHPHIVTIFSVEEAGGVHFFTMELVEGESLSRCIPEGGLPQRQLAEIAGALADALAAAHEKGVVHRDLKPANVMVTQNGRVKVLDFGLAKETQADNSADVTMSSAGHTEAGVVMGTPAYMSPEQVAGRAVDHRTDIFSLGILLYEMATGRRPFEGRSSVELASSILRDAAPLITDLRADLPGDLARIIRRCLEKDPRHRIQTAQDVANELRDFAQQSARSGSTGLPAVATASEEPRMVIVVLPFVNRSPDPGNEYFSDGLTEEVITDLSRIEELRVISRNSAMALKGTTRDTPSIRKELGVTHVVSGSVRRAGDALRVTAELIDAATDTPMWSEKYSGTVADVFGIQEEIAQKIVAALKIRLTESGEQKAAERPIDNVVAYECYLRARQEIYNWTPESQDRAIRLVDQALAIVGENPLLLAAKGQICWNRVNSMMDPDERHLDEAAECSRRALALDPQNHLAIFVRGLVAGLRGQTADALRDCQRSYQLRPSDPNALAELTRFANAAGIDVEAYIEELVQMDPLTPVTWLTYSYHYLMSGRFEKALAGARRAIELAPVPSNLHFLAASAIAAAGMRVEAIAVLERTAASLTAPVPRACALLLKYALEGEAEKTCAQMTPLVEESAGWLDHLGRFMADCYSLIGRNDEALRWIRIGMDHGYINYPFLAAYDPLLANVRQDARFAPLMQEVKARWEALGRNLPPPLRLLKVPENMR